MPVTRWVGPPVLRERERRLEGKLMLIGMEVSKFFSVNSRQYFDCIFDIFILIIEIIRVKYIRLEIMQNL